MTVRHFRYPENCKVSVSFCGKLQTSYEAIGLSGFHTKNYSGFFKLYRRLNSGHYYGTRFNAARQFGNVPTTRIKRTLTEQKDSLQNLQFLRNEHIF